MRTETTIHSCEYADDNMCALTTSRHNGLYTLIATVHGAIVKQQYHMCSPEYALHEFKALCHERHCAYEYEHASIA